MRWYTSFGFDADRSGWLNGAPGIVNVFYYCAVSPVRMKCKSHPARYKEDSRR
ncbi:MAG: hypothetical protein ABSF24_05355 [Candidatus Bathyarchaeia archaeon]